MTAPGWSAALATACWLALAAACGRPAVDTSATDPAAALDARLSSELKLALADPERVTFDVVVTFRQPPRPPPAIPGLWVHLDMGQGRLDRNGIRQLVANEDVVAIELEPVERPVER